VDGLSKLPMPVDLPIWGLASLKITRQQLQALLGAPHFTETDPRRTCGGEEDGWAYVLPTDQRVLVVLDVTTAWAELFGDPPELEPILLALGIPANDPRLVLHAEPWAMK
jgi:hypothetical protein